VFERAHTTSIEASSRAFWGHAQAARAPAQLAEVHVRPDERATRSVNGRAEPVEAHAERVLARSMLFWPAERHIAGCVSPP
jgi:hypothetical protein